MAAPTSAAVVLFNLVSRGRAGRGLGGGEEGQRAGRENIRKVRRGAQKSSHAACSEHASCGSGLL